VIEERGSRTRGSHDEDWSTVATCWLELQVQFSLLAKEGRSGLTRAVLAAVGFLELARSARKIPSLVDTDGVQPTFLIFSLENVCPPQVDLRRYGVNTAGI